LNDRWGQEHAEDGQEEAEGERMMRWRMKRTDWIMLVILTLLGLVGWYFGVIVAPGLGGHVVG
jgi:hypothetical protein